MQVNIQYLCLLFFIVWIHSTQAQEKFEESIFYKPVLHVGLHSGASQYFGELNTKWHMKSIRSAQGIYVGRDLFLGNLSLKLSFDYIQLYAADRNANDKLQQVRNLDFRNNLSELALHLHLKLFQTGTLKKESTIFLQMGAGYMWFDPYTIYADKKVFLRPLGTEGQFSYLHPDPMPYSNRCITTPIGFAVKTSLSNFWKLTFNLSYRYTSTGYLDDVYSTYAGFESFPPTSNAYDGALARMLQNRSNDIAFGHKGSSRGNLTNDQFMTFSVGLEYRIWKSVYKHRLKYLRLKLPGGKGGE